MSITLKFIKLTLNDEFKLLKPIYFVSDVCAIVYIQEWNSIRESKK